MTVSLSTEQIQRMGEELDEIRQSVIDTRGERDAAYIRKVIKAQRSLEAAGRLSLLVSLFPPAWVAGTTALSLAKILENMEIGHNVLHGQWDWMRDPEINSGSWEWDTASPSSTWKHSHNELHHVYTNILGKDNDVGYGVLRMDEAQRWSPFFLGQPLYNVILSLTFQWAIAAYDLEIGKALNGRKTKRTLLSESRQVLKKMGRQVVKDYVVHPLLAGPSAVPSALGALTANLTRNVWSHAVIFCGHFPAGAETFPKSILGNETRGDWYLRQMRGSANISGGPLLHLMTGNLSFQIEHHLFPDLPSNRYAEIAPQVREICERYGVPYTTGPMTRQLASTWAKVFRLALPPQVLAAVEGALDGGPTEAAEPLAA